MESPKTVIYFVRHGEVHNPKNVWYGRLPDFRLSKKGKEQMSLTAEFLHTKDIAQLYSSPLLRAMESAKILQKVLKISEILQSEDLLEIQSSFEGSPFSYVRSIDYNVFADPKRNITGDTIYGILSRMEHFITTVTTSYSGKNIVAVSHGDPIMILKAKVLGLPMINASLRPGPEHYIQQGEVYQVVVSQNNIEACNSIFKPRV